jgi:NAD(P)-dependent dehydrogenase (short-subunit alcohol dehydrogenase family)
MKIQNSVALVTGANRGLGLAFTQALRAAGARKIYAAARDPASVHQDGVEAIRLDVTKPEEVAAAARSLGDVSLVINNAGISRGSGFLGDDGLVAARAEFETNFFGPLVVARAFAPILAKNGGGAVVNVLSALSWVSMPTSSTYCASKSAAWSLSNGLRHELRGQSTQVLSLHVGFMDTDMVRHVTAPKSKPEEVVAQTLAALEAGKSEVLADDVSRRIKQNLSAEPGVYLEPRPAGA